MSQNSNLQGKENLKGNEMLSISMSLVKYVWDPANLTHFYIHKYGNFSKICLTSKH